MTDPQYLIPPHIVLPLPLEALITEEELEAIEVLEQE